MASLEERLAARREQLQQERTVVLPVPGYEDMLAVRYRIVGRRELQAIAKKNEGLPEDDKDIADQADTLIAACVELLEVKASGEYESKGMKWSTTSIQKLFNVDLPEGAGVRAALLAVFPPTETEFIMHFSAYDSHLITSAADVDGALLGESAASSATEEPSTSPSTQPSLESTPSA